MRLAPTFILTGASLHRGIMNALQRYYHDYVTGTPSVITPDYPRWDTFFQVLTMKLTEPRARRCENDFRYTRHILTRMTNVDVEGTIEQLQALGAHCDCQILLNIGNNGGRSA